jgi:hypothetical protein
VSVFAKSTELADALQQQGFCSWGRRGTRFNPQRWLHIRWGQWQNVSIKNIDLKK